MIRHGKSPEYVRLALVRFAREHGIKPAARAFAMSVRTVRKWFRRADGTLAGLKDHSRAPHRRPQRISTDTEAIILALKRRLPTWGAERLKRDFALSCSAKAIARVYRQNNLIRPRRRKHRAKHDLRAIKQQWPIFQQIDMDTKDLFDIPEYWPAMTSFGLPRCQYTARDVVSGLTFLAYAQERSLTYATLFADRILTHLKACGADPHAVTIQTDNGSEFVGSWQQKGPSGFTKRVEHSHHATHRTIPPGAHTYQSDVETLHGLIEHELFVIEPFHNRPDFLDKVTTYQLFFNYARTNSYKQHQTPIHIIRQRSPTIDPRVGLLPPLFLESLLPMSKHPILSSPSRGYHVPSLP
jgi:transposase